ncbi:MAG: hypothetical protein J0L52_01470 [Caulobacterales bacterium]|nr:hypothetical protein [Caulobacterales bacterium]
MRSLTLLLGVTAALVLAGCEANTAPEAEETLSTGAAEDEVSAPELSAEQAQARAFRAAWDSAAPVTASDPRLNDEDDARWPEPIPGRFEFRSAELIQLSSDLYALVSSGHVQDGGRTTKGALAFHYLARTDDGFRRVGAAPLFIAGGGAGQPPTFTVRHDLTPATAIVVNTRTENGRGTCTVSQLIELTPSQPVLRATSIPTGFEATSGDGSWTGALETGQAGRDFDVQYSGASDAEATWVFTDAGTYRASGQPRLSGC